MKTIYLDNFRGFSDSAVSLRDVNFCVGENSSGKTSFLSISRLLSSFNFWFSQSFEAVETGFGHFDDMASINSSDRSFFRIGIAERHARHDLLEGEVAEIGAFLFTYRNYEGMPRLHKCTYNSGLMVLTVVFSENSIRYKTNVLSTKIRSETAIPGLFRKWAKEHSQSSAKGYRKLGPTDKRMSHMPPLYVLGSIQRDIEKKEGFEVDSDGGVSVPGPPSGGDDIAWIAPIRTRPRRTYDEVKLDFSPEGEHTPYMIKKILDGGASSRKFKEFVQKFGEESGLFKSVQVHRFGKTLTSPFELDIVLESSAIGISNVGYGVSQALPVVVELFVRTKGSWFAIQQPEVHLHPRAQAAFGELIHQLAVNESKKFIVETHSDFTIDRYRIAQRESNAPPSAQVLFFERKSGKNQATSILIDSDGELAGDQPSGYRKFFLKEELRVLGAL